MLWNYKHIILQFYFYWNQRNLEFPWSLGSQALWDTWGLFWDGEQVGSGPRGAKASQAGKRTVASRQPEKPFKRRVVSLTFRLDFCKLRLALSQLKLLVMPAWRIPNRRGGRRSPNEHLSFKSTRERTYFIIRSISNKSECLLLIVICDRNVFPF